jgi:hypothetical protein
MYVIDNYINIIITITYILYKQYLQLNYAYAETVNVLASNWQPASIVSRWQR